MSELEVIFEVSDRFRQGSLFRDVFFTLFQFSLISSYFLLMMEFILPIIFCI